MDQHQVARVKREARGRGLVEGVEARQAAILALYCKCGWGFSQRAKGEITEFLHGKCLFLKRRRFVLYCFVEFLQMEEWEWKKKRE
jgi:hypothetical protein